MMRFKRSGRWVLVAALSTATAGCQNGTSFSLWNPFAKPTASAAQKSMAPFGAMQPAEESFAKKLGNSMTKPFKAADSTDKKPKAADNDPISLATKTSPPNAELYVSLAKLQERSGNATAAIEEYNKALDAEPKNLPAMLGLARLYDRQGRYDDALKLYRTAVELHSENATLANDFGLCLARSGNIQESARLLRKAVSLDPEKVLYRNNLATVLVELDRADEALQTLIPAHGESVAHYNIGFLLNKRDTDVAKAAAYKHFQAAAKLNPDFKEAQQWLTVLKKYDPNPNATSANAVSITKDVELDVTTPIATPVPRSEEMTMPRPAAAVPATRPAAPYPTTSIPGTMPTLPLITTEPPSVPTSTPTPVPARTVSQPTVLEPAAAKPEEKSNESSSGPQLNLNPQSRTTPSRPSGPPAAVPPVPEQISNLTPATPSTSPNPTKPAETKSAARYPASRY